jgi:hypothetical protein
MQFVILKLQLLVPFIVFKWRFPINMNKCRRFIFLDAFQAEDELQQNTKDDN